MGYARSQCLNYGYWHRVTVFFFIKVRSSLSHSQSARSREPRGAGAGAGARGRAVTAQSQLTTRDGGARLTWAASGRSWLRPACWPARPRLQHTTSITVSVSTGRLASLYSSYTGRAGLARSSAVCYRAPATKHITSLGPGCREDVIEIRIKQSIIEQTQT